MITRYYTLIFVAAIVLTTAACNNKPKPKVSGLDTTFSWNIATVGDEWPDEEKSWSENPNIARHQQRIYEEMGTPDFFWVYWRPDGSPLTSREIETQSWIYRDSKNHPLKKQPDLGWIYLADDKLIRFRNSGPEEIELTDMVRTICDLGDPHEIKDINDEIIYQYYDEGKIFYYRNGELYKEQDTPRMEGFYDRK